MGLLISISNALPAMQLPSQQKLRASRSRPGATPRGVAPEGAPERRSAPHSSRGFEHVSSGPTLTAAMPQQWDAESAPAKALRQEKLEAVSIRFEATRASDTWHTAGHATPQVPYLRGLCDASCRP